MGASIQGLNRSEVRWDKLKPVYMWNDIYHLRRTKFVVYQLATTFVGVGPGLGTPVLDDFSNAVNLGYNPSPIIGAFAFDIVACLVVSGVFFSAFIFDLLWPERVESRRAQLYWQLSAVLAMTAQLAATVTTTTAFVMACRAGAEPGASPVLQGVVAANLGRGAASLVFNWIGLVFVVYSTALMFSFYKYYAKFGPFARHFEPQQRPKEVQGVEGGEVAGSELGKEPRTEKSEVT